MILSHLVLGFVTSYIGYISPSMLNITASKIYIENDKKVARQFIIGASATVFIQVFLAIKISEFLEKQPQIIHWIQSLGIVIFSILSIIFIYKALSNQKEQQIKTIKNSFLFGLSLSFINMFAIPFFAITYSSFIMYGWVTYGFVCTSLFGLGTVLGTFTVLSSYVFLAKKVEGEIITYTKYFNLFIGIITGLVAIYSIIKLYF